MKEDVKEQEKWCYLTCKELQDEYNATYQQRMQMKSMLTVLLRY